MSSRPAVRGDRSNAARFFAERGADADVAVVDAAGEHTYAQLRDAVAVLEAALAAEGLREGDRVAILGRNSFFWVAAYLAVIGAGLVAVPCSEKATPADIARNLGLGECRAVLADRLAARGFDDALRPLPVIDDAVLDGAALDGASRNGAVPAASGRAERVADPADDAVLMFTSGTTSRPKAVRITHANLMANTESIIAYLGLTASDRVLVILPFYYCYGASLLHTHLRVGGTVVLCNTFAYPETAVEQIAAEQCTVLAGVPSSYQLLLRVTTFAQRRLPSLRIVQQAGGKLSPVLVDELIAAQPHANVFVMYGQTEATARLSYVPPEMLEAKRGSVGKGIPGVELTVRSDTGEPVAVGERGEIYAVGENISPGYLGDREGTAAKFTPYGLRTGDLAVVDEDGYIFVVDRIDDFIKTWGYRVSSQEVESAALRLAELVSAAAIGVPDEDAGEAISLFVTIRPGSDVGPDDVLAHCRSLLAKHMVPASVQILQTLPLNANGKVDKNALRRAAYAAAGQS